MIITIDGPAGVGKTTISLAVAEKMRVAYLDSGAMFRGLALALGSGSWNWPENRLLEAMEGFCFSLNGVGGASSLLLNNRPLSEAIRSETIGVWASNLGRIPLIRDKLKKAQQDLGRERDLLAEGRDMGTVIFPEADYKFFLEADPAQRAKRRWLQLRAMSVQADLAELVKDMRLRDKQDRTRSIAPLLPAREAYILDTTSMTQKEVIEAIMARMA
ncbi:MAG: (d)CMP kinase [Desulfohalobiaceae bacterium]|nr:(d)CMP kinase [Desulfohalobiaceae bacterium]